MKGWVYFMENILNLNFVPQILILLMTIFSYIIKPGIFTLLTAKKSERLLASKELEFIYKTIIYIFLLIITPIFFTYDLDSYSKIYDNIIRFYFWIPLVFFVFILYILEISFLKFDIIKKFKVNYNNIVKNFFIILGVMIIVYMAIGYGLIFHKIFLEHIIKIRYLIILIFISIYYIFFIHLLHSTLYKKAYQEIIHCNIKMDNNQLIENAYFSHLTYGNKIVLSNSSDPWKFKQNIIIPMNKIQYIEFLSKEIITWGEKKEVKINKKININ